MSNVIDIDALRVARKSAYVRAASDCRHMHVALDDNGDVVKCDDCGLQLSAYWALGHFVEYYQRAIAKLTSGQNALREAQEQGVHLIAARRVEKAWRSRTMVPTCPHCSEPIFPQDGFGRSAVNRAIAERRRQAAKATK
jgi:ribosomal protein S27E